MSSSTVIEVGAILFDMDGTLIDSTPGVYKAWEIFAKDYSLGDSVAVADKTHGRRLYDTLREICKIEDETTLLSEINRFEDGVIEGGPTALPGAKDLILKLLSHPELKSKWTVVTSASNGYAGPALLKAGILLPTVGLVTANDVKLGKPHPDPYLSGSVICGVPAADCLVVEDAVSGLLAGRRAGAKTLAVCTSTPKETILRSEAQPDFIVQDLTKVEVDFVDNKFRIRLDLL